MYWNWPYWDHRYVFLTVFVSLLTDNNTLGAFDYATGSIRRPWYTYGFRTMSYAICILYSNIVVFRCTVQYYGAVTSRDSYVTKTSSLGIISRCESTVTSVQHLKPFSEVPGPRGLPLIGTLWDFAKPNGLRLNKLFEVQAHCIIAATLHFTNGTNPL